MEAGVGTSSVESVPMVVRLDDERTLETQDSGQENSVQVRCDKKTRSF